jgi:putative membrane protein
VVYALAIMVAAALIPGIEITGDDLGTFIVLGIVVGLINGVLRPILTIITLPLSILTLGIFFLILNGLMLLLADAILESLSIDGLFPAILGAIVMAIVGSALENLFGLDDKD